ncbi:MAG: glycine zipper 2TM domain-containing protein [Cyanobium sp. PLM2.Bin73]|nr:MAG: glycine zipper 2TM domain-containing protein [Cyanobium sp. PLM2.Bin73]
MRTPLLPLALVALSLPAPALAFPSSVQAMPAYQAVPVYDVQPQAAQANPPRTCRPALPVMGAVFGGTVGTLMANSTRNRSRNRRWALPMGAAAGGLFGGAVSGC